MEYHRISKPLHSCAISGIRADSAQNVKIPDVHHRDLFVSLSELISTCLYSRLWSQSPYCILSPTEHSFSQTCPSPRWAMLPPHTWMIPCSESINLIQVSGEKQLIHLIHPNIQKINSHLSLQGLYAFLDTLVTNPWKLTGIEQEMKCVPRTYWGWQARSDHLVPQAPSVLFLPSSLVVCNVFPNCQWSPSQNW